MNGINAEQKQNNVEQKHRIVGTRILKVCLPLILYNPKAHF